MATVTNEIRPGQVVTFVLDDKSAVEYREQVVIEGSVWCKAALVVLQRAMRYTAKALVDPQSVAELFWDILRFSFGLPDLDGRRDGYRMQVNEILATLNKTHIGMSRDLTLADISLMPGLASLGLKVMCGDIWANPNDKLAGLVYSSPVEMATNYLKSFLSSAPNRVKQTDLSGPIHLNFQRLLSGEARHAVITLIHEGTHKFAATTDSQYFPDGKTPAQSLQESLDFCKTLHQDNLPDFNVVLKSAREMTPKIGSMGTAITNLRGMTEQKKLSNADSYANFVADVSDLLSSEELKELLSQLMGSKKK